MADRNARSKTRFISGSDIAVAVSIPVLKAFARVLPESAWHRFGRLAAGTGPDPAGGGGLQLQNRMKRMLEGSPNRSEPDEILAISRGLEIESVLQVWRAGQKPDWRPAIRLAGTGHLDQALAGGAGAILWVGHFVFASLCTKMALYDAGHEIVHLSHPRHGFSPTRFGIRYLNPGRQRIEARYLAERVEIKPANPAIALRRLRQHLQAKRVVSITAGVDAARPAFPAFLGDRIALATGAADLAYRAGTELLPVFVYRDGAGLITVKIEAPIPIGRNASRQDSSAEAARIFADRQAAHVRVRPEQWLGWPTLPPREAACPGRREPGSRRSANR